MNFEERSLALSPRTFRQRNSGAANKSQSFEKFADILINHLAGILNYCRIKVCFGVIEIINGNIQTLLRPRRGYKNLRSPHVKVQCMAITNTEFAVFRKAA